MRSPSALRSPDTNQAIRWLVFFLASLLLIAAPIIRGGNRQVALVGLLGIGAALIAVMLASISFKTLFDRSTRTVHQPLWWMLLVGVVGTSPWWLAALQLTPIPASVFSGLAGRDVYLPALAATGAPVPAQLPLSLQPSATWTALVSGMPAAAAFFAALFLNLRFTVKAIGVLLAVVACQMLLAVLQAVQGPQSIWYFDMAGAGGLVGSFANRNHLADLLAMAIPLWFYRSTFVAPEGGHDQASRMTDGEHPSRSTRRQPKERRSVSFRTPLWLFFGFCLLVVLLSTLSRGGILSGALILAASTVLFVVGLGKSLSNKQRFGLFGAVLIFSAITAAAVGLESLNHRLDDTVITADAGVRGDYASTALHAARVFWPWGSGAGSFESVFPRFQAPRTLGYVEYAHNDYAQVLMELGAPGVGIGIALLVLVLVQLKRLVSVFQKPGMRDEWSLRCHCGLGVAALLLHSFVDFNMHIPALAITAAFLMGAFLRPFPAERRQRNG